MKVSTPVVNSHLPAGQCFFTTQAALSRPLPESSGTSQDPATKWLTRTACCPSDWLETGPDTAVHCEAAHTHRLKDVFHLLCCTLCIFLRHKSRSNLQAS